MSAAYSSKHLTYPITVLQKQLLYRNKADTINDCIHYGIKCENDRAKFIKDGINIKEKALVNLLH